jgi:hypothetical protein
MPRADETRAQRMFEVQRFTREDHLRGLTEGWCLYGGWYQRMGGLVWGWFRREAKEERTAWK